MRLHFYFSLFDVYVLLSQSMCVARVCTCVCVCDEMRLDVLQGCSSTEATWSSRNDRNVGTVIRFAVSITTTTSLPHHGRGGEMRGEETERGEGEMRGEERRGEETERGGGWQERRGKEEKWEERKQGEEERGEETKHCFKQVFQPLQLFVSQHHNISWSSFRVKLFIDQPNLRSQVKSCIYKLSQQATRKTKGSILYSCDRMIKKHSQLLS